MISSVMRKTGMFFLSLAISCSVLGAEQAAGQEYHVEGYVSAIKSSYLYLDGQRYFLAPDVKFALDTDYGRPLSGKEIYQMRWIARARIHVRDNKVTRVTVLKLEQ